MLHSLKRWCVVGVLVACGAIGSVSAQEIVSADEFVLETGPCTMRSGSGAPEGAVTGAVCDVYVDTATGNRYTKVGGTGNTGWAYLYRASGTDVPVADGGTGASTLTQYGVLYGNAASAISATAQGAAGTVLIGGAAAPSFSATPTVTTLTATNLTASANLELNPTGDLTIDPTGNDALPESNYDINLGSLSKKYLTLHAAELWVETLVAQNTIATIGGRILVGPTTALTADLASTSGAMSATAGMLSSDGVGAFNAAQTVDGNTGTNAWHTDTAVAGAWVKADYGAGNEQLITRVRIYADGATAAIYKLQWSANDSDWTDVCTLAAPTGAGWVACYTTGAMTARRYWRLYLTNEPGAAGYITELEFLPEVAITVKHNEMAAGDVIYFEANGSVEFMNVNEGPSGEGPYNYYVTRDLDGTGRNAWYAGDAAFNTGTTNDGFMDLYSVRGVKAATEYGPSIVGNVRTATGYNAWAPRWACGNLNGVYGYAVTTYGCGFGDSAETWVAIDSTNGFRVMHGATTKTQIDASGNATFTGTVNATAGYFGDGSTRVAVEAAGINVGNTGSIRGGMTAYNTGTGFWIGYSGAAYKLSIGHDDAERLIWDGTNLDVFTRKVTIGVGSVWGTSGGVYFTSSTVTGSNFGVQGSELGGGLVGRSLNLTNVATSDDDVDVTLTADNSTASPATVSVRAWDSDDELAAAAEVYATRIFLRGSGGSGTAYVAVNGTVNTSVDLNITTSTGAYGIYNWAQDGKTANFYTAEAGSGYLRAAAWTYGSDRRLKQNIQYGREARLEATDGLTKILALRPARFDYTDGPTDQLGFVAQDVQPIIPEAVVPIALQEDLLGLKTDFILPYAVLAIQNLETRVKALEAKGNR